MTYFLDSELIINPDGTIYHLHLRPDQIAEDIIFVGDTNRVSEVSQHFSSIQHKAAHREFVTHTGFYNGKRLTVISTGIGTDNIDIVLNELDALVNIDFESRFIKHELTRLHIIRLGTSGSLQKDIPVDSFVASTHGLGLDNLMHFYRLENNEEENQILQAFSTHTQLNSGKVSPYINMAGASLIKHFTKDYHHGITVTCPGFYGPQGRILRLGLGYPMLIDNLTNFSFGNYRITNFEMETSAIYGLGNALGHHCLSLSAIVANRISKEFSANGALAVENLIKQSLQVISESTI